MGVNDEELALRISGDSSGGQQAIEQVTSALGGLGSSFVARVAEGMLLRDAIREVIGVVKEGIAAIPQMVEHSMALGNQLYELSLKTGASVENLSALRFVATQTGLDFDRLGTTFFMMEKQLGATGAAGDKVNDAIKILGLDFQTLKNEKPDQAFIDILQALSELPNRADQAHAAMTLFGRGAKDIMGLTQESIHDLIDEANDLGLVMSTKTAAAGHAAEIGMKAFGMEMDSVRIKIGSAFLPAVITASRLLSEGFRDAMASSGVSAEDFQRVIGDVATGIARGFANVLQFVAFAADGLVQFFAGQFLQDFALLDHLVLTGKLITDIAMAMDAVVDHGVMLPFLNKLRDELANVDTHLVSGTDKTIQLAGGLHTVADAAGRAAENMKTNWAEGLRQTQHDIDALVRRSHDAAGTIGDDFVGANEQLKKYLKAWEELNSTGESYAETAATIDQKIREQIEYYLEAGNSVTTVAAAYPMLTEAQVNAVYELIKANDRYAKSWEATQADITKVWDEAFSAEQEHALKGIDLQIAKLDAQQQREADAARKQIKDEDQLQEMLAAIDDKYDWLRANAKRQSEQRVAEQTAELWIQYYDTIGRHAGRAVDVEIANIRRWYDEQVQKARAAGIVSQNYYDALVALAQQKMLDVRRAHDEVYQAIRKMQEDLQTNWVHTFAQTLVSTGSFRQAFTSIFAMIKSDVESIFSELLGQIIKGFLQPLLDYVSSVTSRITSMIINALSGGRYGGGGGGGLLSTLLGGGGTAAGAGALGGATGGMILDSGGAALLGEGAGGGAAAAGGGGTMAAIGSAALTYAPIAGALWFAFSHWNAPGLSPEEKAAVDTANVSWNQKTPQEQAAYYATQGMNPDGSPMDGAETTPIPSFDRRALEMVTKPGLVLTHPGDVVGVPKAGMFGGGVTINVDASGSIFRDRAAMRDLATEVARAYHDQIRLSTPIGLR